MLLRKIALVLIILLALEVLFAIANRSATSDDAGAESFTSGPHRPPSTVSSVSASRPRSPPPPSSFAAPILNDVKQGGFPIDDDAAAASTSGNHDATFPLFPTLLLPGPCIGDLLSFDRSDKVLPPCLLRPGVAAPRNLYDLITNFLPRYSLVSFMRLLRNATLDELLDTMHPAPCVLMLLHTTACHEFNESFTGCVKRLGIYNVEKILPGRCVDETFWTLFSRKLAAEKQRYPERFPRPDPDPNLWKNLPRGEIPDSTTWTVSEKREYVPPEKRTFALLGPPVNCSDSTQIHPFGFGIPIANIAKKLPLYKAFDFMPLTPPRHMGARGWSKINISEEQLFRTLYSASYFAFTNVRGGVDCMRHYEILASGTIPYFPDLPLYMDVPVVTHLPRRLLLEVLDMPGVSHLGKATTMLHLFQDNEFIERITNNFVDESLHFRKPGVIRPVTDFDVVKYQNMAETALNFTRHHLSCGALVASMLRTMQNENPRRVLLISRFEYDYMHMTIHSGFSELGINVTVVGDDYSGFFYRQRVDPAEGLPEKQRGKGLASNASDLYGGGFVFSGRGYNRDGDEFVTSSDSRTLEARIIAKEFDLVIYTWLHRRDKYEWPYLAAVVNASMSRNQLAWVDHDDWFRQINAWKFRRLHKMGFLFGRELRAHVCVSEQMEQKRQEQLQEEAEFAQLVKVVFERVNEMKQQSNFSGDETYLLLSARKSLESAQHRTMIMEKLWKLSSAEVRDALTDVEKFVRLLVVSL